MGEPPRRCSICGESYAAGVIFCPRDGSALSLRALDNGPDPYLGQTIAGAFRVEALIGIGAVGRVYRAHQLGIERSVALKIMHRDLVDNELLYGRFRREARVAGALAHPNLVQVLAFGELEADERRIPFLAFEYLDGLSLRSAFLAQGAWAPARARHILLQIAEAVGVAHQHGIVHRDLKPENVMLVQRGDDADFVKVLDFGTARADHAEPSISTHAGAIFGSPRYVSPESAAGGEATASSDVYALATLGYESLAGRTPFDGENAIQILLKQQAEPIPPLLEQAGAVDVPPDFARFIERNLAKNPAARAADARTFARELAALSLPRVAGGGGRSTTLTRRGHRAPLMPAIAPVAAPQAPSRALGAALVVLLCFALGAGAALGVASRLGVFTNTPTRAPGSAP